MNDNKLKYNIKLNNSNQNFFDLQLFNSVVNPYTFTLDGNYDINAIIEMNINLVDLSYYYKNNNYKFDRTYLSSGLYASNMEGFASDRNFPLDKNKQGSLSLFINTINVDHCNNMKHCFSYAYFYDNDSMYDAELHISKWNTSNVIDMSYMFYNCGYLGYIDGIIDMQSCTEYTNMFNGCTKLKGVKIKNPPEGFDGAGLNSSQYTIVS